jgi:hypothetical protein
MENTELTLDALREMVHTFKRPELPPSRKIGRFEKLMNRLGWYRQTEFFVLDIDMWANPYKKFWPINWDGFK